MHHYIFWIATPLLSAAFGYLLWQAVKARAELLRVLGDDSAIAERLDRQADWRKAALADARVQLALRDKTLISINTPILFRSFENAMLRVVWVMGALVVAAAVAAMILVSFWLGALVLAVAGVASQFDLHPIGERKVAADLTALALSLHLWYEYDAEICENVLLTSPRFANLLRYVKAHFPEKKTDDVR
ncbi:MAG: hypothetical protein ACYC6A_23775 [Armatimonadota bacterium]